MAAEMQDIDIRDFTSVGSVEDYDHVVLSLFGGASAKMRISLLRDVLVRGITPSIGEDGTWYVGEEATGVTAGGKTPEFRKGAAGIEYKYTSEDGNAWRTLVGYSDIRMRYEDLTEEQILSLKLGYEDLTEEDIAELQKPAADMIAKLEATDTSITEAESARVTAEEERKTAHYEAMKQSAEATAKSVESTSKADAATEAATSAAETAAASAKDADASAKAANEAAASANEASSEAGEAVRKANTAAQTAEQAASAASVAAANADNAASGANTAATSADDAASKAAVAANSADESASKADAAAQAANEAAVNANTAVESINDAVDVANSAARSANESASNADVSANNAEGAATAATEAASKADNAANRADTSADSANTAADNANIAADTANRSATTADESAEDATLAARQARNLPKIQNGTWWLYDITQGVYVDSGYAVSSDFQLTREGVESVLTGNVESHWHDRYVDKVEGKQLTTEDFTTVLKEKLEGLNNYDDAEISEAVEKLRKDFDTLVSGNTEDAIESFNEVVAFLEGLKDAENLAGIIAFIQTEIGKKADTSQLPVKVSQLENDVPYATSAELESGLSSKQGTIEDLDSIRSGAALGATALQFIPSEYVTDEDLSQKGYATVAQLNEGLGSKQGTITDLASIREGAVLGKTAIQEDDLANKNYATKAELGEGLEQKQEKNLYFSNVSVSVWVEDDTYESYPYRSDIPLAGVTPSMIAEVIFGINEVTSGQYAPICETKEGVLSIWSNLNKTIVIPTIIINK